MNQFTDLAEDMGRTLDFYEGLLGLSVGLRPNLGFPGALATCRWHAGCAVHQIRAAAAEPARRGARPHGLQRHRPEGGEGALRCARRQVRPAPASWLWHLETGLLRPQRAQAGIGLRREQSILLGPQTRTQAGTSLRVASLAVHLTPAHCGSRFRGVLG